MIEKTDTVFEQIKKAACDCCGDDIKLNFGGNLPDHLMIGGYENGKNLEAIVCMKCVKEKLSFINIQRKDNTIGYC